MDAAEQAQLLAESEALDYAIRILVKHQPPHVDEELEDRHDRATAVGVLAGLSISLRMRSGGKESPGDR